SSVCLTADTLAPEDESYS
ncbi:hypothetical protein A2U01_0119644, partial [Trifolium medium]|nr:hypothetical protein [Trifolium medium]